MSQFFTICQATLKYTPAIKVLADLHRNELGFLPCAKLQEAVVGGRTLLVLVEDEPVAFMIYRHRKKDAQTTLSAICVSRAWQQRGLGRLLIATLCDDCKTYDRTHIQLKCPVDLPANTFYQRLGFHHHTVEPGRVRKLNVWRMPIYQQAI